MVNRVFVTPSEVRGYGNIISEKTTDDFSLYQSSLVLADNVYTLSYNAGVTVSLGLSSSTVSYGTSVTLTATVLDGGSPVASGGTVTFYDGTTSLGTGTTGSDGKATLSKSDFTVGSHTLKAVYSTVNSSTVTLTVNKITSTISLSATSSSITVGSNAELSGTLSVGSGKTVTIYQNGSSIGTVTTGTNGAFTKSVSGLSAGTYSFTAGYDGDDTHTNVTSTAVSVTVTAITVSSVTLASNKDILSYADSDSCTLSATVVGSDSNPMSGVSVEFFKGSTSLGTSTTNSSGVATKSYASAGSGDVSFTAECGDVVSEPYIIEDCIYYWDCLSNDGHWTLPSGFSFDSNGVTQNQASNVGVCDVTIPSNVKMECTMKYYSVYKFLPTLNQFNVYSSQDNENMLVLRDFDDSNAWNNRTIINNTHLSDGLHTIIIQNNVGTLKEGSTTLGSKNLIGTTKNLQLPNNSNSNRKYSVKDIKIKPL